MDCSNEESVTVVNECVDHLQKLVKLRAGTNPSPYIGSAKNLLHVVSTEERAMRHFTSPSVGGIPLTVSILEHTQDMQMKHLIVTIIKEMLQRKSARNERAAVLAASGAANPLLKLISKTQLPFNFSDEFVSVLCSVTAKIGKKDKKFAMKARLLGVLSVITSHMRLYTPKPKVLNSVLMLLKRVLVSVNAIQLSKADLIPYLLAFLDTPRRRITPSVMYSLEAISMATRSRHAARQFVKNEVTEHLLHVFFNAGLPVGTNRVKTCRMIRTYNAVLNTLLHMTQIKSGREAISAAGIVVKLVEWCRVVVSHPGSHWDRIVVKASLVVQRCLPPRFLPVSKCGSVVSFSFPEERLSEQIELFEPKNDVSDSDSPVSSNSSSFESDGDYDQDSDPIPSHDSLNGGEYTRQYRSFFEELKEEKEMRSLMQNPYTFYEDSIDFEEPLVFVAQKPNSTLGPQFSHKNHTHGFYSTPNTNGISSGSKKTVKDSDFRDQEGDSCACSKDNHVNSDNAETLPSKFISCINISKKNSVEKRSGFSSLEVRNLVDSAKEEKRSQEFLKNVDTCQLYQNWASKTISVVPFVKLAYPDTKCCFSWDEPRVKLNQPASGLIRMQILKHLEEMTNKEMMYKEIYNLDNLLCETATSGTCLKNTDEERIAMKNDAGHLLFESRFESGNLRKVIWKGDQEYDLILNPDINSKNHHQWFYFEVSGTVAHVPHVFNIINMEKTTSLFNEGMCPVMFSVRSHLEKKQGWVRAGSDICYYRNHYVQGASAMSSLREKPYYTLTFTVHFAYSNDVCYFAYHYPYTYSALQTQIDCWLSSYDTTSAYCRKDELCRTLAGNPVPLLTITAKPCEAHRPFIFLTARVHPGESNSSWAMKGTLDFLFSSKPSAHRLREMYIFKVVPMLNPDGVINGCHRCSLSGQDLNRQWITPQPQLHPTIYNTRNLLWYLNSLGRKPLVFCDFHGHSRRHNVFLYGCNPEQSWWTSDETKPDCQSFKIIPLLMHHMVPTFGLDYCSFNIDKARESTARVAIWRQFAVALSYTMECTYGGCDQGLYAGYHIGISQLEETGAKLCQCFGKIVPSFEQNDTISCTIPVDVSMLSKLRNGKPQDGDHPDSFSSSLSEDDMVENEDNE